MHVLGGSQVDREVLRFEDKSNLLSTGSTGHLHVDEKLISELGLPLAFFVCAALAFLEYQEDADAYQAAQEDLVD